jgi:molybdopterin/thiamine biosynthesis adenylyltransferase
MDVKDWLQDKGEAGILSFERQEAMQILFNLDARMAEGRILDAGLMPERYARNPWNAADQKRLHGSTLAVVGCGALGSALVEQFLRLGAGTLKVMDPDVFSPSNLNRQIFLTREDLGRPKVAVAAQRAQAVNPALRFVPFQAFFGKDSAETFLEDADLVLDALDNIPDRLFLEKICGEKDLPLIHGAVSGWAGQVGVVLPGSGLLDGIYKSSGGGGGGAAGNPVFGVFATAALQAALACRTLLGKEGGSGERHWFLDFLGPEWVAMD